MLPLLYLCVMLVGASMAYVVVRTYQTHMVEGTAEEHDPMGPLRPLLRLLAPLNGRWLPKACQRSALALRFSGAHRVFTPPESLALKELIALALIGLLLAAGVANPIVLILVGFSFLIRMFL